MSALSSLSGTARSTPLAPGDAVLVRARLGHIDALGMCDVIFTVHGGGQVTFTQEVRLSLHRSMLLGDSQLSALSKADEPVEIASRAAPSAPLTAPANAAPPTPVPAVVDAPLTEDDDAPSAAVEGEKPEEQAVAQVAVDQAVVAEQALGPPLFSLPRHPTASSSQGHPTAAPSAAQLLGDADLLLVLAAAPYAPAEVPADAAPAAAPANAAPPAAPADAAPAAQVPGGGHTGLDLLNRALWVASDPDSNSSEVE